jgi:threonylcarbamoyladenosine tRNA methylthiotransferase CDKAL1
MDAKHSVKKSLTEASAGTVYIKTFGCSVNQSDSEVMSGLLKEAGFFIVTDYSSESNSGPANHSSKQGMGDIDIVIINSCTVKNLAESKFFRELRRWQRKNVRVVVAGCIPQAEESLLENKLRDISVIGTRQIMHIVSVVNDTMNGKVVHYISNDYNERLNLPKIRRNATIEIIPISEGCLSYCTYCKTRFARGQLMSYPREKIIKQFRAALKDGCREFWITSQDNGCYGFDIYRKEKYFLPQLLDDLLCIEGEFRIRLGMSNPDHVDRIKEDLVRIFRHPKMYKFLHIPVQSGNNRILGLMKRQYTVEEFRKLILLFRKEIPDITISTDIIVGFPEETDEEFSDTLKLLKETQFEVVNLSRFWLRSGTETEKMKQLQSKIIKERSINTKLIFDRLLESQNKDWLGKTCTALVDEHDRDGSLIARNDYYKQIRIRNPEDMLLGDFVKVRITDTAKYYLVGERVK